MARVIDDHGVPEVEKDDEHIKSLEKNLSGVQEEAERFRAELRKVTNTIKPDKKVHEPLLDDSAFLYCNALQEFRNGKDQEPDPYVKKWGESLAQIRQIYNQMAGLQHVLIGGLESWATDPTYAIGDEKKALDELKSAYETSLKRWRSKSNRSNTTDGTMPALEGKVITTRREYEAALRNYTSRLTAVMAHMKAEFYDRLTSSMFAAESFFNAGNEVMAAMQPLMLEKRLVLEKSRLEEINRVTNIEDQPPPPQLSASMSDEKHHHVSSHNERDAKHSAAAPSPQKDASVVLKDGPLLLKKSFGLKNWHNYHFEVRTDGVLYWYKKEKGAAVDEDKARKLGQFIHLMLATAKPIADSKYEHCFEVITPTRASIQLRASSAEDRNAWMECFRRVVSEGLAKSSFASGDAPAQKSGEVSLPVLNLNTASSNPAQSGNTPSSSTPSGSSPLSTTLNAGGTVGAAAAAALLAAQTAESTLERLLANVAHEGLRAVVQQPANRKCADCNSPTPEWASINLGLLMCTECSGVHRSMGTHVSKVRSLTLDKWESVDVQILAAIGNDKANKFWEFGVIAQNGRKPAPNGQNLLKQMFINCKYVERVWIPHSTQPLASDMLFQKLFWGIATSDLVTCSRIIALGAEVNAHTNPDGKTLLHGASEEGNALCLEFLLLNGGDALSKDDDGRLPLHYACGRGDPDCIRLLVTRMSDAALQEKDAEGFTPKDFMLENGHADLLPLLTTNAQQLNTAVTTIVAQRKATAAATASAPPSPQNNPFAKKGNPPPVPPSTSLGVPSSPMSSRESKPIKLPGGGGDLESRSKIARGSRLQSVHLYRPSNPGAVNIQPLRQSTQSHLVDSNGMPIGGNTLSTQPPPVIPPLATPSAPLEFGSVPLSPSASRPAPVVMSLRANSPAAASNSASATLANFAAVANSTAGVSPQRKISIPTANPNSSNSPPVLYQPMPMPLSPKSATPPPRPNPTGRQNN